MPSSSQLLFLDTEFTDFINTELISIGAVTEDGKHEFYAEVSDYRRASESQFVKENIVPLLDGGSALMPLNEVSARFGSWVESLPYNVKVCIDYSTDWELTLMLLHDVWPSNLEKEWLNVYADMQLASILKCSGVGMSRPLADVIRNTKDVFTKQFYEHFFVNKETPKYRQHHALYDARANREAWMAAMEYIKNL